MTEGDTGGFPIFLIVLKPVPVAAEEEGLKQGQGRQYCGDKAPSALWPSC